MDWHASPPETAFEHFRTSEQGLTDREAALRYKKFGANHLSPRSKENIVQMTLRQFHNPLIYMLLACTLLAILLGKITDSAVVMSVVILNTLIGFIHEYRSSRTIESLLGMIPQKSEVVRNGIRSSIPSDQIVPGDFLVLQPGDRIAADIRLCSVKNLQCDESALTGESVPVVKTIDPVSDESPIPDRTCIAYSGTLVASGTGSGIAIGTGLDTEFGKISELLDKVDPVETPLTTTLKKLARSITTAVCFIGAALFPIALFRGYSLLDGGIASIALAVAVIPEGLPATITIAAAIGVRRIARRKGIIRHLAAVETLGSATVICTDKTGTLTQNELTVQSIWIPNSSFFATGIGYSAEGTLSIEHPDDPDRGAAEEKIEQLLEAVILCNDASIEERGHRRIPHGDPTEVALIVAGRKKGLNEKELREKWPRIDFIPFDSEKRIMATLHDDRGLNGKTIFLKGAPESVLHALKKDSGSNSSPSESLISEEIGKMARKGFRVIAAAKKEARPDCRSIGEEDLREGFIFLGLLGMIDPPRPEVFEAIRVCREAGIQIKMVTGDHPLTASVIGEEIGLEGGKKAVTGFELNELKEDEWEETAEQSSIFARVLPEHKLEIVKALQAKGHVVAMTGDGVNDAPALKRADIGIAMGISGTAVAKEAADMVLADDNFSSIKAAVEEGRRVYDNLIKSIAFIFPTSLAQGLVIFIAILFFPVREDVLILPILPIQILWINLIVAVALSLSLAFEGMELDIMRRPPRNRSSPILNRFIIIRTFTVAAAMAAGTIALFFNEYFRELGRGMGDAAAIRQAQTLSVTSLMFFQIFYLLNCRSFRCSIFKIGFLSNPYVLLGIGLVTAAQIGFVYIPFMNFIFDSSPLNLKAWGISIGISFLILPLIELEKWISTKKEKR